jgi:hypothetical protein
MGAIGEKRDLEFEFDDLFEFSHEPTSDNEASKAESKQPLISDSNECIKTYSTTIPLNKVGLQDFKILKLVGKGAFGKVCLGSDLYFYLVILSRYRFKTLNFIYRTQIE